jgi:pimeloyl-ACP methyl ester carboxylesterase
LTRGVRLTIIKRMDEAISQAHTTGSVTSTDGTSIGYRQLGHGPGVILIHGGMQASQNLMKLAMALQDAFTVYIPDRRGRGRSGPFGDDYGLDKECEDLNALLGRTGARNVFGLSAGAIVVLKAALILPGIEKVAVYEPPLVTVHTSPPMDMITRYKRELAEGKLAAALVTVIKGIADSSLIEFARLPRFLLVPLIKYLLHNEARQVQGDDVPIASLIPTFLFDAKLARETEGLLADFGAIRPKVLLLGGSKSARFLRTALDDLQAVLPDAKRVELKGLGHVAADNTGRPDLVAMELKSFFAESRPGMSQTPAP